MTLLATLTYDLWAFTDAGDDGIQTLGMTARQVFSVGRNLCYRRTFKSRLSHQKGDVARDHEGAAYARQIGRETLSDAIDEILPLRIANDIGEGQNDDRKPRR